MPTQLHIISMDDLKRVAERASSHWFEPGSMRFFRCRLPARATWLPASVDESVCRDGCGVYLFVSSEQGPDGVRKWSVRRQVVTLEAREGDGRLVTRLQTSTVGEFQAHATAAQARKALHAAETAEIMARDAGAAAAAVGE